MKYQMINTQNNSEYNIMQLNLVKLNSELSAYKAEKEETSKKLVSYESEKSKLQEKIKELEEKLNKLEEKAEVSKKEEAAVVIAVEESVNKKVIQNIASIGVPEGMVKEEVVLTNNSNDSAEIYKKYEMLSGKEKINFFKENEKTILREMKKVHYAPKDTFSNLRKY